MANAFPNDDEYEIPLREQRYFGAGIKRKRIHFVPSTSSDKTSTTTPSFRAKPATSVADAYLAVVLKQQQQQNPPEAAAVDVVEDERTCPLCNEPLTNPTTHESSLTHQICLAHSHPPSHVDRTRKGFAVLESQGWDPDSRKGLGAAGSEGRLYPVKTKDNPTRAGLGAEFVTLKKMEMAVKLDAGKARLSEAEARKKAERLRNAFYRSEEVEKYLGEEQVNTKLDLGEFRRAVRGR